MAKKIGDVLKESRINAGISVEKISDILTQKGYKASIKTIYSWESGNSSPGPDALLEMCDIYKIDNILDTFGYSGYKEDGSLQLNMKEIDMIEKYRFISTHSKDGASVIDTVLDREYAVAKKLKEQEEQIQKMDMEITDKILPKRMLAYAYYGKIAAAGTSVEFSGMTAGIKSYAENDINVNADYVIGVSGDSMQPEYYDGDVVYVQKTKDLNIGDIGIFQKANSIYIKKMGENGLISLNPNYPGLTADDDRIIVLGKVLGRAE